MVYRIDNRSWFKSPTITATTEQTGVTNAHRTMFLAYSNRRNITGSSIAAMTLRASGPSTLVAGTSEYIQAASTSAKASGPCNVNTSSRNARGRKNQAEVMRAPLTATVITPS